MRIRSLALCLLIVSCATPNRPKADEPEERPAPAPSPQEKPVKPHMLHFPDFGFRMKHPGEPWDMEKGFGVGPGLKPHFSFVNSDTGAVFSFELIRIKGGEGALTRAWRLEKDLKRESWIVSPLLLDPIRHRIAFDIELENGAGKFCGVAMVISQVGEVMANLTLVGTWPAAVDAESRQTLEALLTSITPENPRPAK